MLHERREESLSFYLVLFSRLCCRLSRAARPSGRGGEGEHRVPGGEGEGGTLAIPSTGHAGDRNDCAS